MSARRSNKIERRRALFERKFGPSDPDECWVWLASRNKAGNGLFGMGDLCHREVVAAHVASYFFYRDQDRDYSGVRFQHLCGNASCVNPRHLLLLGPNGLVNGPEVLRFIASRHPSVHDVLADVAGALEGAGE